VKSTLLSLGLSLLLTAGSGWSQSLDDLFRAVQESRPEVARKLLSEHPELARSQDRRGHTALLRACYLKRTELARLLLDSGADPNLATGRGTRPLHAAAWAGAQEIAQLLLDKGTDVNAGDGSGRRALHWASWRGYPGLVQLLLERKAVIDEIDVYGQAPIHLAARAGRADIV
jgi:ankyrin repeat protein